MNAARTSIHYGRLKLLGMAVLLFFLVRPSCTDLTRFPVAVTGTTTIAGSPLGGLLSTLSIVGFEGLDLASSEEFQNQGVAREDVNSVNLDSLVLRVISPEDQDLSFLSEVSFFVEADGLERKRLCHQEEFPADAREVAFQIDELELVDYVSAPSMTISTEVTANSPSVNTEVEVDAVFMVSASVQGACTAAQEATAQE